ncbi:MAG TPA: hypothetical protein VF457_05510 [Burkholderiaceae bacterium]
MPEIQSRKSGADAAGASRLHATANWACFLFGVACLGLGVGRLWQSNIPGASLGLGAGLLLVFAATVDRFELLKGLGIEAKTRQIDDKLAQADEALRRIRELSELTGANLVFLHSKVGRWEGPAAAEGYRVAQEVKANLAEAGSSPEKIRAVLDPWVRVTCGDILSGHARELERQLQRRTPALALQRSAALMRANGREDAASLNLRDQLDQAAAFIQRLNEIRNVDLQSLPAAFLQLYDEAPLLDRAEAARLREAAQSFMPVVLRIRDDLEIPDPQHWCREIDLLLERAARSD